MESQHYYPAYNCNDMGGAGLPPSHVLPQGPPHMPNGDPSLSPSRKRYKKTMASVSSMEDGNDSGEEEPQQQPLYYGN